MKKILTIIGLIVMLLVISGYIIYQNNVNESSNELIEIYNEENLILETDIQKETKEEIKVQQITVEIKGEVVSPGVYKIDENSRVIDLINMAGGLTENAVTNNINLAKALKDEMVVVVYNQNDLVEEIKTEYVYLECTCPEVKNDACIEEEKNEESDSEDSEKNEENKKISINNATLEELTTLNGIGEKTANKIIEYRKDNPFKDIEDIKNVSGIGESLYEKIKDSITI